MRKEIETHLNIVTQRIELKNIIIAITIIIGLVNTLKVVIRVVKSKIIIHRKTRIQEKTTITTQAKVILMSLKHLA